MMVGIKRTFLTLSKFLEDCTSSAIPQGARATASYPNPCMGELLVGDILGKITARGKNPADVILSFDGQPYMEEADITNLWTDLSLGRPIITKPDGTKEVTTVGGAVITYTPPTATTAASISLTSGSNVVKIKPLKKQFTNAVITIALSENPCAEEVFTVLLNSSSGASYIINQFNGGQAFEAYNYHVQISNIPERSNGITSPEVVNGTITTAYRCSFLKKATKVAILRTMIHESLHAYMVAYEKLRGKTEYLATFSSAFKSYKDSNRNLGVEHHNQIANNMRALISNMLKEFDNNRQSQQFYDDLAWGGLAGTDEYEALSDFEKNRINNTLLNEQEGNANSKGEKCVDTGGNCR